LVLPYILLCNTLHWNEIIQCYSFCNCLILFNKVSSRYIHVLSNGRIFIYLFVYFLGTKVWTQCPYFEPLHQHFLVIDFFRDRVLWTIWLGWLWTVILLISAPWVARIIGLSHQHLTDLSTFKAEKYYIFYGEIYMCLYIICNTYISQFFIHPSLDRNSFPQWLLWIIVQWTKEWKFFSFNYMFGLVFKGWVHYRVKNIFLQEQLVYSYNAVRWRVNFLVLAMSWVMLDIPF
jgi:hypothetical protein